MLPPVTQKFWGEFQGCILWKSKIKNKVNTAMDWWNRQATIRKISHGGVTDVRWTVGVIKRFKNQEPDFLARPYRVVIQIIDYMIRRQKIKIAQSIILGNPQGAILRLHPTLYSPWRLHLTDFPNSYNVLPIPLHI